MKPLSERYSTIIGMVALGQPGDTDRDVWHEVAALEARIEALEKRLTETGVRVEDTLDDLSHVLDMLGATEEQLALSRYTLAQARSVASSANLTGHGDGNTGPTAALRGEEER